jgi:hypothetical protein
MIAAVLPRRPDGMSAIAVCDPRGEYNLPVLNLLHRIE